MRKNTRAAFMHWDDPREPAPRKSRAIHVVRGDGGFRAIYSYDTPILVWQGGRLVLNVTKYNRATSMHQNGIRALLASEMPTFWYYTIDNLPRGCSPEDVLAGWGEGEKVGGRA
jgi:hypothetical protein